MARLRAPHELESERVSDALATDDDIRALVGARLRSLPRLDPDLLPGTVAHRAWVKALSERLSPRLLERFLAGVDYTTDSAPEPRRRFKRR